MGLTNKVDIDKLIGGAAPRGRSSAGSSRTGSGAPAEMPNDGSYAGEFFEMVDKWHGYREIWDDQLEADILRNELEIRTTNRKRLDWGPKGTKYFSPSSSNSCARELYMKITGAKKDEQESPPHQGRWRRLGTAFGDTLQRDLMFIEKHWAKEFGLQRPAFVPERVEVGGKKYPAWEKFAQKIIRVEHRGRTIPILGQPDGILTHVATGARVGLEIKSKQTSAAQTSAYSMREPKTDHAKQVINYSIMYGTPEQPLNDFIICYGNLSKKSWYMDDETYAKNPDLRTFNIHVTEADRIELLDFYLSIICAIENETPPPLELDKWTFNNFKTACALSLEPEELADVRWQVENALDPKKVTEYAAILAFIEEVRARA